MNSRNRASISLCQVGASGPATAPASQVRSQNLRSSSSCTAGSVGRTPAQWPASAESPLTGRALRQTRAPTRARAREIGWNTMLGHR